MKIASAVGLLAVLLGLCCFNMNRVRQFLRPIVNAMIPKAPKDGHINVIPLMTLQELRDAYSQKRVLIVGGTRGVGRGISLALAEAGADITIVGRSEHSGSKMLKELREKIASPPSPPGQELVQDGAAQLFEYIRGDLSTARSSLALVDRLLQVVAPRNSSGGGGDGRFDYMVVTAGVFPDWGALLQEDRLEKAFAVSVLGRYALYRNLHRLLRNTEGSNSEGLGGGRVLNVLAAGDLPYAPFNRAMARGEQLPSHLLAAISNVGLGNEMMLIDAIGQQQHRWRELLMHQKKEGEEEAVPVTMVSTHPGLLSTDLHSGQGWLMDVLEPVGVFLAGVTEEECGYRQASILASPALHPGALSYVDSDMQGRRRSEQLQKQLEEHGPWLRSFLDGLLQPPQQQQTSKQ